jgi:hypothetical protein
VGGVQGTADLLDDVNGARRLERPVTQDGLQVAAHDEAHRDVQLPVDLARVVDRDDARMLQRRRQPRLAQEALPKGHVTRKLGG